ncbi:MAG: PDDEXK nuclease domain-containing protein [Bacteroidota bacterium]
MEKSQNLSPNLFDTVADVIQQARRQAYRSSNGILLRMYWKIGQLIVEDEQAGAVKAAYGKAVLRNLSHRLTEEFGRGFDESNLRNMRTFFLAFPNRDALRPVLSWTHYRMICRIDDARMRELYVAHAVEGNWSTRTLQRNIRSHYLGRLVELPKEEEAQPQPKNLIKDPYIFEFLGVPTPHGLSENDLETALINQIQHFLMELGKGFAFVARQQHISTDTADFYIDLVFYNYRLKCFVLIDLKTQRLNHEAIGQMDMYVRMYNDLKAGPDDQPTLGIILCTDKDETVVRYSVLAENEQLFASKYRLYLPTEEELKQLIEEDKVQFELRQKREDD